MNESMIDRENRLQKIALDLYDLYERCEGDHLTINEFNRTLELLRVCMENDTRI